MKKSTYLILAFMFTIVISKAQTNYLDAYIGNPVTITTIGSSINQVNQPTDLDFKPGTNELWVANYGTSAGGSMVIFYNAGLPNQVSQYRKDTHSGHFMIYPSSMAFGDDGKWAAVSEIQSTGGPTSTFMGPALWSADTSITARVFQNNWVNGYPLGSHLDMLHQSPYSMGIAHDSAMVYWVMDGHNGNICKYDFVSHHGPGYDNHSARKVWRYIDVPVARVAGIPSHMILDKTNGWLYFIDGGNKTIKRLDTNSGTITGNLTVPTTGQEPLASYKKVEFAVVEVLDTLATQPCGIDYFNGRLIVSDYTTGDIYLYNTVGTISMLGTISTGHPGMMGVKIGPDGHIWCVNKTESKIYRLDVAPPTLDASLLNITAPLVENYLSNYYSTTFNVCDGNITPAVEIKNTGSTTITDIEIQYMIDGSAQTVFTWNGTLLAGSTASVALPSSTAVNGSHQLSVEIMMVNGTFDDVESKDLAIGSFRVINHTASLPFTETFTAISFPPVGWNYVNFNPNCKMSRATTGGFGASTGSLKMDNYSGDMDITGQKDYLISPIINMSSASANTWLRFNVAYAKYNTSSNDALQVVVSTDCGNTWTSVYNKSGTVLSTAPIATSAFTPSASQWRTDSVSLASFSGQSELIMMFTSISNYGNNFYVDDIFVGDISTGITEIDLNNSINIYPNPVVTMLNISSDSELRNAEINILNVLGKTVLSFDNVPDTKNYLMDFKSFTSGVYFVQIIQGNNIIVKKIIKE